MNLLLIDSKKEFVEAIKRLLKLNRHRVDVAYNGIEGLRMAEDNKYDVIFLDVVLPGVDGFTLIKKLRGRGVGTPIIIVTDRSMIEDRVKGLDSGADDYLVKPFAIEELSARIRALVRREKQVRLPIFRVGDLVLDPASHKVRRKGKLIRLNNKEYQILVYFFRNKDRVITREEIGEAVWGKKKFSSNIIDVHVRYLRRKIDRGFKTKLIQTVRGAGYRLT